MFSLHFPDNQQRDKTGPTIGRRLAGRALGFAAGLTLAVAFDALVLDHAVAHSLAQSRQAIAHAVLSAAASVVGR